MTKKDLLKYKGIKQEIESLSETIEKMQSIKFPKIPKLTGMPNGKGTQDSFGDAVADYIDRVNELSDKIEDLVLELGIIEDEIAKLKVADQRSVLRYKYFCGMTWTEVADVMGWSESTCRRLHTDALKELR